MICNKVVLNMNTSFADAFLGSVIYQLNISNQQPNYARGGGGPGICEYI